MYSLTQFLSEGLMAWPWWGYVLYLLVATHFTILAVTLYLHRDQTHRGVDFHPVVRHVFRFWLWLTTGMKTREWVAVHRKHHAKCESEEDPHSPQQLGLSKVLFQGAELYRQEAANRETVAKFGRGTPDDWIERNVYSRFPFLGVSLLVVINFLLMGVGGVAVWALQMIAIPFLAAGVVNGVGHYWGYRNFECPDAATNVSPFGFILCGEELHNNHHAFPSSAKFALRRWEFDWGWVWLRLFSALGLARIRRVAPQPELSSGEDAGHIDLETVQAVIVNRYHVLRAYTRMVTLPAMRESIQNRGRRFMRRARRLLVREPELLDERHRDHLDRLLSRYESLGTVFSYREALKQIWRRATSNEQLVRQFREWCAEAEATGNRHLEAFARRLRSYRLPELEAQKS